MSAAIELPKEKRGAPTTPAIPTTYANVLFRSRLEARWAAMFDLMMWPWDYEPIDLEFYIPDFILRFPSEPVLCEVKPALYADDLWPHSKKIVKSGWDGQFLIVGGALLRSGSGQTTFGITSERIGESVGIFDHAVCHRCAACGRISYHHESGGWGCPVGGCESDESLILPVGDPEIRNLWNAAGTRVQWRPNRDNLGERR